MGENKTDSVTRRATGGDGRVAWAVRQLESISLHHEKGELVGSEPELLERLGVSRPTLRQAAKVAAAARMISVRPGVHGGYYAERPTAKDSIRMPARYLRLQGATLRHVHEMSTQLFPGLAALATRCKDERLWDRLTALRSSLAGRPGEADDVRAIIESEVALGLLLAEMTTNPLHLLVQHILFEFGDLEQELKFYRDEEDRRCTRELQVRLCDAVLARDEEETRAAAAARLHMLGEWIDRYGPGALGRPRQQAGAPRLNIGEKA